MADISYELAKELKDAGFPQHPYSAVCFCGAKTIDDPHHPTLSELIEACEGSLDDYGADTYVLFEGGRGIWRAKLYFSGFGYFEGSTPEEAVSRLWLALNVKPEDSDTTLLKPYLSGPPGTFPTT